ncbi:MAG: hypothetical protein K9K37_10060 [Desulfocapsa sp.]|nr:hypothetical protein [Desulfocapsa sp.]
MISSWKSGLQRSIVEQTGMVNDVAFMSLKYEGITKFRTLRPKWTVGLLSSMGVDGLITDEPALARDVLDTR